MAEFINKGLHYIFSVLGIFHKSCSHSTRCRKLHRTPHIHINPINIIFKYRHSLNSRLRVVRSNLKNQSILLTGPGPKNQILISGADKVDGTKLLIFNPLAPNQLSIYNFLRKYEICFVLEAELPEGLCVHSDHRRQTDLVPNFF